MSSSNSHNQSPYSLSGQTAVVTGSSSGIGRAIALEFAAAGANVVVHARSRREAAEQVADQVRAAGVESKVIMADVGSPEGRTALVEAAWQWRSDLNIWVNNAGADVLTGEAAHWPFEKKLETLWRVDVEGTMLLSRAVGRRMVEAANTKTRTIINIGWDQAEHGMAGESGEMFSATKGAVMAFTRSLAQSLSPHVRVNCLALGWIRTAWGEGASEFWQQRAQNESLLARWGLPEDVGRVATFLASSAGSFINGQVIPVNGGFRHGS